tara:strand:- start:231 stop:479 length:249 start_codon:yes stop_codon:yes gene_type:complete
MATGDVTISVAVEGGVTKSVVLDSATRVLARAYVENQDENIDDDAKWQTMEVNKMGNGILNRANKHGIASLSYTPKTFTAAT